MKGLFFILAVTFQDLPQVKEGEEISIKGFYYHTDEGDFLSSQPNLRSCCVSKFPALKLETSLGDVPSYQVIEVKGILHKDNNDFILKN